MTEEPPASAWTKGEEDLFYTMFKECFEFYKQPRRSLGKGHDEHAMSRSSSVERGKWESTMSWRPGRRSRKSRLLYTESFFKMPYAAYEFNHHISRWEKQ